MHGSTPHHLHHTTHCVAFIASVLTCNGLGLDSSQPIDPPPPFPSLHSTHSLPYLLHSFSQLTQLTLFTHSTPLTLVTTVRESVEFQVQANRVRLQLPQALLPPSVKSVLGQSVALSGGKERICQVGLTRTCSCCNIAALH